MHRESQGLLGRIKERYLRPANGAQHALFLKSAETRLVLQLQLAFPGVQCKRLRHEPVSPFNLFRPSLSPIRRI
jgi:hypothetical protein